MPVITTTDVSTKPKYNWKYKENIFNFCLFLINTLRGGRRVLISLLLYISTFSLLWSCNSCPVHPSTVVFLIVVFQHVTTPPCSWSQSHDVAKSCLHTNPQSFINMKSSTGDKVGQTIVKNRRLSIQRWTYSMFCSSEDEVGQTIGNYSFYSEMGHNWSYIHFFLCSAYLTCGLSGRWGDQSGLPPCCISGFHTSGSVQSLDLFSTVPKTTPLQYIGMHRLSNLCCASALHTSVSAWCRSIFWRSTKQFLIWIILHAH
jgi:hypothetical protein